MHLNLDRNYFKVKVSVLGVLPQNLREMTQLYCPRCIKTFSFKDMEAESDNTDFYVCPECDMPEASGETR